MFVVKLMLYSPSHLFLSEAIITLQAQIIQGFLQRQKRSHLTSALLKQHSGLALSSFYKAVAYGPHLACGLIW